MSGRDKDPDNMNPGKKGRVFAFPRRPLPGRNREPNETDYEASLLGAWQVELADLAKEKSGRRCRLSLDLESGRQLTGFLAATGIEGLVLVAESRGRLTISADKQTITRLVVWRALDLGLNFKVEFEP